MRPGFYLGIIGEWRFAKKWYLQPELTPFYYVGAKGLPLSTLPPPPEVEDIVAGNDVQRRLKYFAIPVVVKYALAGDRIHLGLGPQVGFLSSATDTYLGTSENGNSIAVDQDVKDDMASTDVGVVFHLEWKIRKGLFSPSLNARYYLGLTDTIENNTGDAVYNRVLSVIATVPIGGNPPDEDSEGDDQGSTHSPNASGGLWSPLFHNGQTHFI
jgi:hypothetical protein